MGTSVPYPIARPTPAALAVAQAAWSSGTLRLDLPVGSRWWRVLRAPSATDAARYAAVTYTSPSLSRFAPIQGTGGPLTSAYAGSSLDVALCEVVLRDVRHNGVRRVPTHEIKNRFAVEVATAVPLALVDARRPKDTLLAVVGDRPPDLSAAWPQAFAFTRAWAQSLHDDLPGMEGLQYESHQIAGNCLVVFQTSETPVFHVTGTPQLVDAGLPRARLAQLAADAGAVVDFGNVDDD